MKIFKMPQRQKEKPDITEIDLLRDIKILIRTQKARPEENLENLQKFKIVFQSLGDAKSQ